MTDDERRTRQPLSMTRRYRRGLILTGLLCALAVLTAATVLFQRSYAERIDNYLMQICHGYAAAYEAQDTHSAATLLNLLPENCPLRITLIDTDGTVLYDTKRGSYIVDVNGDIYAAQTDLPNHADRPEFQQAMANGSACITRESETLQLETHYYAVRIDLPEGAQVLRVGEDVANIWGLSTDTLPLLCGAVVLILLAATLFSWWLTRRMVQPINHLAEHLDTIEADVPYEELIPLARTIQTDRKLREDNETMRREFTANVSHELKTPLTSISGNALILTEKNPLLTEEKRRELSAAIYEDANWLNHLVENLLSITRIEDGRMNLQISPQLMDEMIEEALHHVNRKSCEHTITTQYGDEILLVNVDARLIMQVVVNLVDNAIKYTPVGSVIQISAYRKDHQVVVEVADNGPGIPDRAKAQVFEMFYTGQSRIADSHRSLGLGLPLCRAILTAHGGTLTLRDNIPNGSVFSFALPQSEVNIHE